VCLQPVGGAAAAALGTYYGIWIRGGPGWRRKIADDEILDRVPGERRRRMKVKTRNCTVGIAMQEGGCVALGRTTKGAGKMNAKRRRMP